MPFATVLPAQSSAPVAMPGATDVYMLYRPTDMYIFYRPAVTLASSIFCFVSVIFAACYRY